MASRIDHYRMVHIVKAVLRIQIRILIRRIHMFLGLPDPDSLVRDLDLSLNKNSKKNIDSYCSVISL